MLENGCTAQRPLEPMAAWGPAHLNSHARHALRAHRVPSPPPPPGGSMWLATCGGGGQELGMYGRDQDLLPPKKDTRLLRLSHTVALSAPAHRALALRPHPSLQTVFQTLSADFAANVGPAAGVSHQGRPPSPPLHSVVELKVADGKAGKNTCGASPTPPTPPPNSCVGFLTYPWVCA